MPETDYSIRHYPTEPLSYIILYPMNRNIVIHPFVFAVYPILFLFAHNIGQVNPTEVIKPLFIVLLFTTLLFILIRLILKDWHRAGLEVSLLLFLTFAYGQVFNLLSLKGIINNDHQFLAAFWAVFLILGIWGIWRVLKQTESITRILNVVAPILLIFPLFQIIQFLIVSPNPDQAQEIIEIELEITKDLSEITDRPDIYYIILDGYARADILEQVYTYDNTSFLQFLSEKGFYIATDSYTNYIQTGLALSASLNMVYLDSVAESMGSQSENREPLAELIQKSLLREFLESSGYKTIAIVSGYHLTEIKDADFYYSSNKSEVDQFNDILSMTTPALIIKDDILYEANRDRILFAIESLRTIPAIEGPKFVFAHLMLPHPPFVFGSSGEEIQPVWVFNRKDGNYYEGTPEQYIAGYRNQLEYTNQLIKDVITDILTNSDETPIIILQADHGPGALLNWELVERNDCLKERTSILNAILIPGHDSQLYPTITPVNTFRLVLDAYLGTDLGPIEDKTFYSSWWSPYDFIDITDEERYFCLRSE